MPMIRVLNKEKYWLQPGRRIARPSHFKLPGRIDAMRVWLGTDDKEWRVFTFIVGTMTDQFNLADIFFLDPKHVKQATGMSSYELDRLLKKLEELEALEVCQAQDSSEPSGVSIPPYTTDDSGIPQ